MPIYKQVLTYKISLDSRLDIIYLLLVIPIIMGCSSGKPPTYPFSTINKTTYTPNYKVSKNDLIQDIDQYSKLLNEVHADPYRKITYTQLHNTVDSLKTEILKQSNDSITLFDSYFYLQFLASKVEDGHTLIRRPTNWRKIIPSSFPLSFKIINDTLIVDKNFSNTIIPKYSQIISINGNSIANLKKETVKYISGTLDHYKDAIWAKNLPFIIHSYFKMEAPWTIKYQYKNKKYVDTLQGLSNEVFLKELLDDYYKNQITIDTLQISSSDIPMLKLNAFNYKSYKGYVKLIDSFFTMHKEQKNIVIDLSENTGGNGLWSLYLLDYFIDSKYSTYEFYKNRISRPFKKWAKYQLYSHYHGEGKPNGLFWWYRLLEDELYYKDILRARTQTFVELDEKYHVPHNKKYYGNVILLTASETWSAGVVFASIFNMENAGTIVGIETGGRIGFTSDPINYELKHSKLIVKIPTAILILSQDDQDSGQKPNIPIILNVSDLQYNRNPFLSKIQNLLKE